MINESDAINDSNSSLQNMEEGRSRLIEQVIRTYSPSGSEGRVASLLHSELKSKGFSPYIDRAGNVVCETGSGNTALLLCGHMDTVPGELKVEVKEGYISGRGACDAKGALLSLLFAFEDLGKSDLLDGRLIFVGVTEEERSSDGLNELISNKIRSDYAIFGEPGGSSRITVGYRGHLTTRLEVVTQEVHASAPNLTANSIEVAFEIYNEIKKEFNALQSNSTDQVSAAVTEIHAGTAHNVIPGRTIMTIDLRLPIGVQSEEAKMNVEKVISKFRSTGKDLGIRVSFDEPTEAYKVRLDSLLVRAMNRAILKSGKKPSLISKSGTGDMNTYALSFGIDAVTYGPGEAKMSHTSEERVKISEIFECSKIVCSGASELFMMAGKTLSKSEEKKEE